MKTNLKLNIVLGLGALVFISCNADRTAGTQGTDNTTAENIQESRKADFVTDVLESSTKEMAWLKAGINEGTDKEVKSNAQKMLSDHQTLSNELKSYAQNNNISLPDIDTTDIVDINEKRGVEWDEEWADEVGDNHVQLVNRFERADRRIADDDTTLKNIIAKTLPLLQSHREASQKLEARLEESN